MYVIRGTVRAQKPGGILEPVPGARVEANGGRGGGSEPVYTADDGTYAVKYGFGGLLLPGLMWNTHPDVHITAPGFEPRSVRLKGDRSEPGIVRSACQRCNLGWGTCCGLEAVLSAETSNHPQAR